MTKSQGYASKIVQIRSRQGLSKEELAARLNVSFATVNRWENGKSEPQRAAKEAINEMFKGLNESSPVLAPATRKKRGVPLSGASGATTKPMEQMLWDAGTGAIFGGLGEGVVNLTNSTGGVIYVTQAARSKNALLPGIFGAGTRAFSRAADELTRKWLDRKFKQMEDMLQ